MVELTPRSEKTEKTCVTVPRDVRERARAVAAASKTSLSAYITALLVRDLAERTPAPEVRAA
jgi:predicted HicB family RNase H-like nuclease